jgi:hypothetical protein
MFSVFAIGPKVRVSNPTETMDFYGRYKSAASFPSEGK